MSTLTGLENLINTDTMYRRQIDETKNLIKKWERSGLLEGIGTDFEKHGMALLLENQAKQLITEANATGTGAIGGNVNQEAYVAVSLPLVRKVFGEIASKEFVSVQPMSLPSGLIFYLDFKYNNAQPGFTQNGSVYGITSASQFDTLQNNGLYGAGRFGYSINETSASLSVTIASGSWADVNYDLNLSASAAASELKLIQIPVTSLSGSDVNGVRAFSINSGSSITTYFPAYTKLISSDTSVQFVVTASSTLATATNWTVKYHVQPTQQLS